MHFLHSPKLGGYMKIRDKIEKIYLTSSPGWNNFSIFSLGALNSFKRLFFGGCKVNINENGLFLALINTTKLVE